MRIAVLLATAVLALSLPAFAAEKVSPAVVEELMQMALAVQKAAAKPKEEKTPEQLAEDKKVIESHCNAVSPRAPRRRA